MSHQKYTHKEQRITKTVMIMISLVLCFLIFDNWLGMTLAQNDALPSYTGKCTKYVDMYYLRGSRSIGHTIYYDLYMDNGLILSTPDDGFWDAGFHKHELPTLTNQEITVYYYPGILPIPPARLIRAYMGEREIVTGEPTLQYFSNQIILYSLALILPGIYVLCIMLGAFFESPYWQRRWPKIRKAIKQWYYRNRH